jgi:hypothetical protein
VPLLYEQMARQQIANLLPGASSADGEQAKFITRVKREADVAECIVKFSPPRGTPFGERWHDLLWTEQTANEVLAEAGFEVAKSRIVETPERTFFESERLDRVGRKGRRNLLSFAVLHHKFVPGQLQNWSSTARALVQQRRLPQEAIHQVDVLRAFGHLIGNTDMHAGNFSCFAADPKDLLAGRFQLAPVYDMLSMRWAPRQGVAPDYGNFDADSLLITVPNEAKETAKALAEQFWERLIGSKRTGLKNSRTIQKA